MIQDERRVDSLSEAAMRIYKAYEKGKGFYSGRVRDSDGNYEHIYNSWEAGLRTTLERTLKRAISNEEQTILSLAIGRGQTPSLSKAERKYSMEYLWDEEFPLNENRQCQDLMRILTCF